jgi:hypothetical protein
MDRIRCLGNLAGKVKLSPRTHLPDEAAEESCRGRDDGVSLPNCVHPWQLTERQLKAPPSS